MSGSFGAPAPLGNASESGDTAGDPGASAGAVPDLDAALIALGYREFRRGQRESVEELLTGGRLLMVAPTGGGKSLAYQLPATLLPGTTLVVSPLISLMHDQVVALEERGVRATYLAGTLEEDEMRRRVGAAARGEYQLIYVAPERLAHESFRSLLQRLECPLVAVDEAHCISEWGHDFRPEYMQIGEVLAALEGVRVLACTATATPVVRDEILERLGLGADTPQHVHGFARPNLAFRAVEVEKRRDRQRFTDALLAEVLGGPGQERGTAIVYAPTRRSTDEEAQRLAAAGWPAAGYHAGMEGADRDRVQGAFIDGKLEVVVATNAFGMGIDRPDVRCVIHLAPPSSVEAYYQEAGRAGRDGAEAVCLLLISPGDMALRRHLIESDNDGVSPDPEIVRHKWNLFLELMRWAEGGACRHDAILRYFGDEAETLAGCGRCDVCLALDEDGHDPEEASTLVRKALCGVARVHGRFGIKAAVGLLRGAADARLQRSGLEASPTFGTLADRGEEWLLKLLRRCVTAGWVDFSGGERPVVVMTPEGMDVIHERRPARLVLPPEGGVEIPAGEAGKGGRKRRRRTAVPEAGFDALTQGIFEALRAYRLEKARDLEVPPYVVASDRSLRDIAQLRPTDLEELQMAHGIGPSKAEKFGVDLVRIVADMLAAEGGKT